MAINFKKIMQIIKTYDPILNNLWKDNKLIILCPKHNLPFNKFTVAKELPNRIITYMNCPKCGYIHNYRVTITLSELFPKEDLFTKKEWKKYKENINILLSIQGKPAICDCGCKIYHHETIYKKMYTCNSCSTRIFAE